MSIKRVIGILMALIITAGLSPDVASYAATPTEGNPDIGCYEYGYESYQRRTPATIDETFKPSDYGENNTSIIYVSVDGNDESGDGTQGAPYASLKKASGVAKAGDTIKLGAGEFVFTESVDIPIGVSLEGEGEDTVITSSTIVNTGNGGRDAIVRLQTEDVVINGNQHISYLTFKGRNTAAWAIDVTNRNNVAIHDCTITQFCEAGVGWHSSSLSSQAINGTNPDVSKVNGTFVTGGRFYNNYLKDNTRFADGWGRGSLFLCGLENFHVYNNKIIEDLRTSPDGTRGVPLKAWYYGGWMRDIKIHDNDIQRLGSAFYSSDGTGWDFAIEMDAPYAGLEISNNHFIGSVDLNGGFTNIGGVEYEYSGWLHDNTFTADTDPKFTGGDTHYCEEYAFTLERKTQKMLIEYNTISGYKTPVFFNAREIISDVTFRYNLCTDLGAECNTIIYLSGMDEVDSETGEHIFGDSISVKNLAIYNNVFSGTSIGLGVSLGQDMLSAWSLENVEVSNNVFDGCIWPWFSISRNPTTVSGLNLENNIVHGNTEITMPSEGVSSFVNADNIMLNDSEWAAAFDDYLIPKEGSPAIDGGKNIKSGLVDLAGNPVQQNESGKEEEKPCNDPVPNEPSNGSYSAGNTVITENIIPINSKISKLSSGKKKLTVKMKKKPKKIKADSYEVAYRVKGSDYWITKSTKKQSVKIKKLTKGNVYEVRARAVKIINGEVYYGYWTPIKKSKKIK